MVNLVRKESSHRADGCFSAKRGQTALRICLYFLLFTILTKFTILTIPYQKLARKKRAGGDIELSYFIVYNQHKAALSYHIYQVCREGGSDLAKMEQQTGKECLLTKRGPVCRLGC